MLQVGAKAVRKRIIGIFHDAALQQTSAHALESAGFEVCAAHNIAELKDHLDAQPCDVVIIGASIPPQEKLRIANFVKQYAPDCSVIELYESSPELNVASTHLSTRAGEAALVRAVSHAL